MLDRVWTPFYLALGSILRPSVRLGHASAAQAMVDRPPDDNGPGPRRRIIETGPIKGKLRDLGDRLGDARRRHREPDVDEKRGTALGLAFRLATELVAGVVIGGGIGWFLDNWLGTMPAFLLVFLALGFAAGIMNVVRTARQMQQSVGGGDVQDGSSSGPGNGKSSRHGDEN